MSAHLGFPGGASGKEPVCQYRRYKRLGFDPWVGEVPWRRAWQPTPVFLPGESPWTEEPGRLQSMGSKRVRHDWSSVIVFIVSPSICHEAMGPDAMILVFWMLSFKPTFSLSSFTLIKRLFSSSSLSAIRVVSSAYLRLLIFLPAVLIPACASSSPAFLMMYCAYKLNKQADSMQPWPTPFPIWKQSVVPCPVLTVASWPAYRFLRRQVRWSGIPISFRIFHSLLWSTQRLWHSQ